MSHTSSKEPFNIGNINTAQIPSLEECKNIGFNPFEYNVIVAVAKAVEKTTGGIIIPLETNEKMEASYQVGRLVRKSPIAFNYDQFGPDARPPQNGDIVMFARYGGTLFTGKDGNQYRIMKDKDIAGTYEEENK